MEIKYELVNGDIIKNEDGDFFTRVCSKESFDSKFLDEEDEYCVTFANGTLKLRNGSSTNATIITFHREDTEKYISGFLEIVICGVYGTFVSQWF